MEINSVDFFKESIEFYHSLKPVFKILSSNEHLP